MEKLSGNKKKLANITVLYASPAWFSPLAFLSRIHSLNLYESSIFLPNAFAPATVAFVANQLVENPYGFENLVSVVMILLSVVFLFWSFGFSAHAVLAMKQKHRRHLTIAASTRTYYLVGIGLFLFFVGLLWSVSAINSLYSIIAAIGYFMIAGILLGVSSKLEQSEAAAGDA